MRKAAIALVVASILVMPRATHANTWDDLLDDFDAWDNSLRLQRLEEGTEAIDNVFQSAKVLFPTVESEGDAPVSILEKARAERTNEFVSYSMGMTNVVLRDVPSDAWFAPYVRDIAERGIVRGYSDETGKPNGLYGPQDNVTVEQMAKVMLLAGGGDVDMCPEQSINLTASGSWGQRFVSCAEQNGWSVFSDGSVDVERPATRAEVLMTLLQAFSVKMGQRTGTEFADVTNETLYGNAVEQAKRDGIVWGYMDADGNPTGTFGPLDPVTRAEFAKIVTLGIQIYAQRP